MTNFLDCQPLNLSVPKCSRCSKMYAIRDIKKDEEILTDYKIYPTLWDEVGL